ncbi:hypothetical protein AAFF_G00351410 [Aldrovandia affinis]|uniref:Uncharacterized protein n=1 Tax=Aldrovandia affinis TaxID=143900 RepID=A0AAD7SIR0_9TELE|nr:hypothetical protein AAFF_G00351410 [Aldrovandia affinis]
MSHHHHQRCLQGRAMSADERSSTPVHKSATPTHKSASSSSSSQRDSRPPSVQWDLGETGHSGASRDVTAFSSGGARMINETELVRGSQQRRAGRVARRCR